MLLNCFELFFLTLYHFSPSFIAKNFKEVPRGNFHKHDLTHKNVYEPDFCFTNYY